MKSSRTSSNLFKGAYSLEQDPLILRQMQNMADKKSRHKLIKQMHTHLATSVKNEDLQALRVVGTNVFQSEKIAAQALIDKVKQGKESPTSKTQK